MTAQIWGLVLLSVGLSASGQIFLKMGMSGAPVQAALASGFSVATVLTIAFNRFVVSGLAAYGFSAVTWMLVLSRLPLSVAYPLVSLGFILVAILSRIVLGEAISPVRAAGMAFVVLGVVLVGRG